MAYAFSLLSAGLAGSGHLASYIQDTQYLALKKVGQNKGSAIMIRICKLIMVSAVCLGSAYTIPFGDMASQSLSTLPADTYLRAHEVWACILGLS